MKKVTILMMTLIGSFVLLTLFTAHLPQSAMATGPTPTPTALASSPVVQGLVPCRLELAMNCDFTRLGEAVQGSAEPRYNPTIDAREVPTHTLISTTFADEMDPVTINAETFYVMQAGARVGGSTAYLPSSRMAVFYPASSLAPGARYTVTLTTGARTLAGDPLPQARIWTFTTAAQNSQFGQVSSTVQGQNASAQGQMNVYFGDLHSHTGYSGGVGTPSEAFAGARAGGLDFFAVTEHDYLLSETEWQEVRDLANAVTIDGVFVGLRGFEYTDPVGGHLNAFETETYVSASDPAHDQLAEFYDWLFTQPTVIGQFNHPQVNLNFFNFAYNPLVDLKVTLREITTSEQFFLSLDAGWHVGTLLNTDTHIADWGCCRRMGLIAPNLTTPDILAAMRARRTFYVSPNGPDVALVMQANGYWMGSAVPNTPTLNFMISAYDSTPSGAPLKINLFERNVRIASVTLPGSAVYSWSPTVPAKLGAYYFVEAYYDGWWISAYSSPIWVEQPPVAEAGPTQIVAPGQMVTLDGRNSSDPDGDALAYRWVQESGPEIELSQASRAQPSFAAPSREENIALRLTVVDPGDLSDSDTTVVTVTNRPVLAIVKRGPTTVEPGALITYTLTVTNNGLTDALGVVITDAVPAGANYIRGGTLKPGNIVTWTVPNLPANGGVAQVAFVVATDQGITNANYGATCPNCVPASGTVSVTTNARRLYLPIMTK